MQHPDLPHIVEKLWKDSKLIDGARRASQVSRLRGKGNRGNAQCGDVRCSRVTAHTSPDRCSVRQSSIANQPFKPTAYIIS